MIQLITKSGMGNQMFEYAYALYLHKAGKKDDIYVNGCVQPYMRDHRRLSLHHFKLTPQTHILSSVSSVVHLLRSLFSVLTTVGSRKFVKFLRQGGTLVGEEQELLKNKGIYFVRDIYCWPPLVDSCKNKHVFGFFQSAACFENIKDELREAFTVVTPPSSENAALIQEISSCNAVCLHVRRGDYADYAQLQVCNYDYYRTAVQQACEVLDSPVFYVFSTGHDDVEWVKQNYHFDAQVRYIDLDNPDYEEIRLMMNCKHFIISNSTFSWWAAALSNNVADKKVWMPSRWLQGCGVDMSLPGWIQL